LKILNLKAVK